MKPDDQWAYKTLMTFGPRLRELEERLEEVEKYLGLEQYVEGHRVYSVDDEDTYAVGENPRYGPGNPDWDRERLHEIEEGLA